MNANKTHVFQKSLRLCALDESSLSIGRVKCLGIDLANTGIPATASRHSQYARTMLRPHPLIRQPINAAGERTQVAGNYR